MTINHENAYCGDLPSKWEGDITAIFVSSIVEGCDYDTGTHEIHIHPKYPITEHWQAKFRAWIGNSKHGVLFVGARKSCRGKWLNGDEIPEQIADFLRPKKINGRWCIPDINTLKNFEQDAKQVKVQRGSSPIEVKFLFSVPGYKNVKQMTIPEIESEYWKAVEQVNQEAHNIWMETHGCESCTKLHGINNENSETGYTPVHPDCKECDGDGIII
jgi:hypothetical protein